MRKKIIGVTVGTPVSPSLIRKKLKPVTSVNGVKADEQGNVDIPSNEVNISDIVNDVLKALPVYNGEVEDV